MIVGSREPASQPRSTKGHLTKITSTPERSPEPPPQGGDPRRPNMKTVRVLVLAVCTGLGTWNRAAEPSRLGGRQAPARGLEGGFLEGGTVEV